MAQTKQAYQTVIGLEVHVQLNTQSKCFCSCSTKFGQQPNAQTCPVCLGFPGSLPVLNEGVLKLALKAALALNCQVAKFIKFDRKNYFYPDLPKNFQISQYDLPVAQNGYLQVSNQGLTKKVRVKRVHLEEDAGKLVHPVDRQQSLIDFNRSGTPLLEIVSEPDIDSSQQAYDYLLQLKAILEYLEVSDCNMQEGSLRCDANVSVMVGGAQKLGDKVELKNMNSFKGVKAALEYEIERQVKLLENNEKVKQETRLWDVQRNISVSMRSKEQAHDYRYFPEPDLVPFVLDDGYIEKIRQGLPELPQEKMLRFIHEYQIPEYDAGVLTADKYLADYFEECVRLYPAPKLLSNWIMTELLAGLNERNISVPQLSINPESFTAIFRLMDQGIISGKIAKEILPKMLDTNKRAEDIVKEGCLQQISDAGELKKIVQAVIKENSKPVADYYQGKENVFMFLIGKIMRASQGKANPQMVSQMLKQELERSRNA